MQKLLIALAAGALLASSSSPALAGEARRDRPRVVVLIGVGVHVFVEGVELVEFDSPVVRDLWAKPDVSNRGFTLGVRF